jgi:hypothetical protein
VATVCRRAKVRVLFPSLLSLLTVALASFAPGASSTPAVISAVSGNEAGMWAPASQAELEMSQMQAAGVQMVRFDAPWQCVEPNPPVNGVHTYDWSDTGSCQPRAPDTAVAMLAEHHLTWLPVIDYSAIWDSQLQTVFSPPVNDSYYAEYAAALAARYGTDGSFWKQNPQLPYEPVTVFEIWNEETGYPTWDVGLKTWSASTIQTEAGRYATLYQDASEAIHAVDPTGKVIVGGMGGGSYVNWYVSDMFKADPWLQGHVDGFGLHPYAADAAEVEHNVALLRTQLDLLGESSAPIYITEVGWPTRNAAAEMRRATWMRKLAATLAHSDCGIALVSPYAWYDPIGHFTLYSSAGPNLSGRLWFQGLKEQPSGPALCAFAPAAVAPVSSTP